MSRRSGSGRFEVDAVLVGGGPAGLAAASWFGRYRRSVFFGRRGAPTSPDPAPGAD